MSVKRISAEALIELAITSLRTDLAPHLPADKRYDAAMVANALEIARREINTDGEAPLWPLLDAIYEEGEGSPKLLAQEIRSGKVSETTLPGLAEKLLAIVEAELAIRNPRFLEQRRGT